MGCRGRREYLSLSMGEKGAESRHGDQKKEIHFEGVASAALVCECSQVSVAEVKYAINKLDAVTLVDLKRRTRMGMGTCQGHLCALRAAGILGQRIGGDNALKDVASFIDERWRGVRPVAWGEGLVEAQFTQWLYEGVCGLGSIVERKAEEDKI